MQRVLHATSILIYCAKGQKQTHHKWEDYAGLSLSVLGVSVVSGLSALQLISGNWWSQSVKVTCWIRKHNTAYALPVPWAFCWNAPDKSPMKNRPCSKLIWSYLSMFVRRLPLTGRYNVLPLGSQRSEKNTPFCPLIWIKGPVMEKGICI